MSAVPTSPSTPVALGPWPFFAPDEVEAAARVLRSGKVNYWTGDEGREFEREFADYTGSRHAIALANGTVSLELALKVLGLQPGDEVIVTPRTFIASASAAIVHGMVPVFADVDRDSGNVTAESIARVVTPRTRAVIPVHLAGWPCDMPAVMDLARAHDLIVVEDCAQAHGATIGGRHVGTFGQAGSWSFCQDKIMTTAGEGGMLALDDEAAWRAAWAFKDHGKSYEAVYERGHGPGFRWLHESFGTNWRLTEVQSAVGRRQLTKLEDWIAVRNRHATAYRAALADLDAVRVPVAPASVRHAYYKFYLYVRPEALRPDWTRDRIMDEAASRGVPCYSGSCSEIYREKAFVALRPEWPTLPAARELGETSLMLLVHPTLSDEALAHSAQIVRDVVLAATR